jgi:XTP/dITP diphosphohydrolase
MDRLVLASNNPGKIREFASLLAPLGHTIVAQSELGIGESFEPHATFIENALAKARHASRASGLPALADDSGICVVALGGAPGVHSARYGGVERSDAANNRKLIASLGEATDRRAYYYCALVCVRHADDPTPIIATGDWWGQIVAQPVGTGGFGYDPHFYLPDRGMTAAELPLDQKNRVSHRGRALAVLIEQMRRTLV